MTILGCKCGSSAANTEYEGDGPFFCLYCGERLKPDNISKYKENKQLGPYWETIKENETRL